MVSQWEPSTDGHGRTGRATSPTGTALKKCWTPPFTISPSHRPWCPLPSTAGRQTTARDPNHWYETTQQTPTTKLLFPPKLLSISPGTWKWDLCLRQKLCGGLRDGSSQNAILMAGKRVFLFPGLLVFSSLPPSDFYSELKMQTLLQATELRESPLPGACSNTVLCCTSYLKQHCWTGLE